MGKSEKLDIGNKVRSHRFHNDEMTQQELAAAVGGVSRQTIVAIEKGKYSPPSLELAFRLAMVFEVSIDEIFLFGR